MGNVSQIDGRLAINGGIPRNAGRGRAAPEVHAHNQGVRVRTHPAGRQPHDLFPSHGCGRGRQSDRVHVLRVQPHVQRSLRVGGHTRVLESKEEGH